MKILYITPLFRGFEDVIKGEKEAKGLPTFILPLKQLVEDGNTVDMILISNYKAELKCNVEWAEKINILRNINNDLTVKNKVIKATNMMKTLISEIIDISRAIKRNKYDFVYCHSTAAVIGNILANRFKVPCGYRLYGTYKLYDEITKKGKVRAIFSNLKYFLIFRLKKQFLIITDDGSKGNKVYDAWAKKTDPYKFFFWINGVDVQPGNEIDTDYEIPKYPYIFMAGRVEAGKGQLHGVKVLKQLHEVKHKYHLILAGHLDDDIYINNMKTYIHRMNLDEYVHFLGPIERKNLKKLAYYARASILWQDVSNAGNVFYEMFSSGAIIVAHQDGSLKRFTTENEDIFMAKDEAEMADKIIELETMKLEEQNIIKDKAIMHSKKVLKNWNQRIEMELTQIYDLI